MMRLLAKIKTLIQKLPLLTATNLLLLFTIASPVVEAQTSKPARLAIIIDDIGNHYELGKRAIDLPGEITYAILPDTPQGARLANYVAKHAPDKEIILHMPMEAQGGQILGNLGLYDRLQQNEFTQRLHQALDEIPNVIGVSNHMGSHLTRQREKMDWLMAELQPRNLFFVDSKTTTTDAAASAAIQHQVPYISRDVFLDHYRDLDAVKLNFDKAVRYAQKDGLAVLIGHPYRMTLSFLEKELPRLQARGVELIGISSALNKSQKNQQVALNTQTSEDEILNPYILAE